MYEKAAWLTLRIGLLGIVFAIIVGFVCSTIQYYKVPVLRQIVAVYIELSRNTPLLVQLFFIYYGLPKIGIQTNAEACGVAGLAFLGGSYMAEAFRSGLEAIEPIQALKVNFLGGKNPRLHSDEVLIALALTSVSSENAERAMEQIPKLRGCQVHTSVMLSEADSKTFKRLGVDLTCEPVRSGLKLY